RGARLTELLKQPQYSPQTNAEQVCVIFAGTQGYLDDMDVSQVGAFEAALLTEIRSNQGELLAEITNNDQKIKGDIADKIKGVIESVKKSFAG
ncbi:MAG: F0F1 ATP synthase subunit alpha, partial [Pseudomonadota bacterium]